MTLRTLLLGSAAALLTVGGAQAADLGAEPVNYVKICDAFGAGFYYAPGTDTCLKISGWTRLDINIKGTEPNYPNRSHQFSAYNYLSVVAGTMTEYGPMMGVFNIENAIGFSQAFPPVSLPAGSGIAQAIGVDVATLSLGPLSAGYSWSSFSSNVFATYHNAPFQPLGANHALFVQLGWAFDGVGVFVAAEDYRTRDFDSGAGPSTGNIPDIVGGITFTAGPVNAKVSGGWGDRVNNDTWGAHGELGFGLGALGNLSVQASYSSGGEDWTCSRTPGTDPFPVAAPCGSIGGGNFLGVYAGLSTNWSAQFSSLLAGIWYDGPGNTRDYTRVIGQLNFRPVNNFLIGAEVSWLDAAVQTDTTNVIIRMQRNFP